MKRKYFNEFRYQGLTRLDHCEGENWDEVWADPCWETKRMTANRARFLWNAVQKECPWIEGTYSHPIFKDGRRYILSIIEDETSGDHWLHVCYINPPRINKTHRS